MTDRYSIAEARDCLSRVVHEAESRGPVRLTRRGKEVAVVLSVKDYESLGLERKPVSRVVSEIRERYLLDELGIDPDEVLAGARETSSGRDFAW